MRADILIKTDQELFETTSEPEAYNSDIRIMQLNSALLTKHTNTSVHLRSSMFILVLNGTASIEINFSKYQAAEGNIILLSFGHFFKIETMSDHFRCIVLYVSNAYINEMYSSEMIYKRIKYGVKMYKTPLLKLDDNERAVLHKRLDFIKELVADKEHRYYKDIILSALLIFFLDLGNIIEHQGNEDSPAKQSRDAIYFQQFLETLVLNYKTEQNVDFYAGKLHITPHYLTLIVKRLSGQTVSDLIYQLLFSEAKLLLQQRKLSIQQIAADLHFSDQSAFGKFFKRKSGLAPKEFRQKAK